MENLDQVNDNIEKDENVEEQSTEATEEITLERTNELAKGLQKGYTLTRQELADIRNNLSSVKSALEELRNKDKGDDLFDEPKPLTRDEMLKLLDERESRKELAQKEKEAQVDKLMSEFRADGLVANKKEEDSLIEFILEAVKSSGRKSATPDYIRSIYPAWNKLKEAGLLKEKQKLEIKRSIGSKVGTSNKTGSKEGGISYKAVHNKDWDEIVS